MNTEQGLTQSVAEAQNHIYDSLGERFGLRIIPSFSSFIVMPKAVGRTAAVGAVLNASNASGSQEISAVATNIQKYAYATSTPAWPSPEMGGTNRYELILAISGDSSLMSRLKKAENTVTIYTGVRKSGGSKWRCEPEDIYKAFEEILQK